jgi:hypothetical protein
MWALLYEFGVDVAVTGHDHFHERFAPQDVLGRRDAFGIQQFVAGTGGTTLYDFGPSHPNSLKLKAYGVLKLTLRVVGYDSVFIESGTEAQHDPTFGTLCHWLQKTRNYEVRSTKYEVGLWLTLSRPVEPANFVLQTSSFELARRRDPAATPLRYNP